MNTELENRDNRVFLSKSLMTGAEYCGQATWYSIHHPRPWIPNEGMVFGSAVDAGVQFVVESARAGVPLDMDRALAAAAAVMDASGIEVDRNGVHDAIDAFLGVGYDWTFAKVQHHIRVELPDIGMVDAHPDLILRDGSVWDIKTAKRSKPADAAATSYRELGFYALLREYETGEPVHEVGYLTWVRTKQPLWQQVYAPVTDEMRRKSAYIARQVATAVKRSNPEFNDTFTNGPAWPGKCSDCQYAPYNGGDCPLAEPRREE